MCVSVFPSVSYTLSTWLLFINHTLIGWACAHVCLVYYTWHSFSYLLRQKSELSKTFPQTLDEKRKTEESKQEKWQKTFRTVGISNIKTLWKLFRRRYCLSSLEENIQNSRLYIRQAYLVINAFWVGTSNMAFFLSVLIWKVSFGVISFVPAFLLTYHPRVKGTYLKKGCLKWCVKLELRNNKKSWLLRKTVLMDFSQSQIKN